MKKSIYSLKKDELTKLKNELIKTDYYHATLMQYLSSIFILLIFGVTSMYCFSLDSNFVETDLVVPFYIFIGFGILFTFMFMLKGNKMLKEFYETKNEKKD